MTSLIIVITVKCTKISKLFDYVQSGYMAIDIFKTIRATHPYLHTDGHTHFLYRVCYASVVQGINTLKLPCCNWSSHFMSLR